MLSLFDVRGGAMSGDQSCFLPNGIPNFPNLSAVGELTGENPWAVAKPTPSEFGFAQDGSPSIQVEKSDTEFRDQFAEQPYRIMSAILVPLIPPMALLTFEHSTINDPGWLLYAAVSLALAALAIAAHRNDLAVLKRQNEAWHARLTELDGALTRWRQKLVERTTLKFWVEVGKDASNTVRGHQFAHEVARLMDAVKWLVLVPPRARDWGIDIVLCAPDDAVVQCKHHKKKNERLPRPSAGAVRELCGTAAAFGAKKGYLVSLRQPAPSHGNRYFVDSAGCELRFLHVGHLIEMAHHAVMGATGESAPFDNDARQFFDAEGRPLRWLDDNADDEELESEGSSELENETA